MFCANEEQDLLPLQTDPSVQPDILISMTLKQSLLPLFFITFMNLLTNSSRSDFLFLTSYTGNLSLFFYHLLFSDLSI